MTPPLPDLAHLRVAVEGRVLFLEFHHGRANEMGRAQVLEIEAIEAWMRSSPLLALVSFSRRRTPRGRALLIAGADIPERCTWSAEQLLAHVAWQREVLHRVRTLPQLHIAVVDGLAAGWGLEWLLSADLVLAGPEARFSLPETSLGIVPGAGGTATLASRVGFGHAARLALCGETFGRDEALAVGLAHEAVDGTDAGLARARDLVTALSRRSPVALRAFKEAALAALHLPPAEARAAEQRAYERCVRSGHAALGMAAFDEIRTGGAVDWPEAEG
jgi:enoyl-CoA hydratase/carnithine racemase